MKALTTSRQIRNLEEKIRHLHNKNTGNGLDKPNGIKHYNKHLRRLKQQRKGQSL